ncbi:MAG TPA: hypothetical protein VHW73_13500 [Rudaea sp.]|nr:hypothetical protein [Rudaea sp.]
MPSFDETLAEIAEKTGVCIGFLTRNPPLMRRFRARIESVFNARGLDPAHHLAFIPAQKHADYLAGLAKAPFVLDSPWFSGGATSLDAIHVGTPIVAWEGDMLRGRQTAGMLRLMGLTDTVSGSESSYIETCIALLNDEDRRAVLRDAMLEKRSILFDDERPVKAFADFLDTVEPRP